MNPEHLYLLPCLHVYCGRCIHAAVGKAKLKHSKYKNNPRRMECRLCHWPIYLHKTIQEGGVWVPQCFARQLPMQADLHAMGDSPPPEPETVPIIVQPGAGKKRKPSRIVGSFETRLGDYYLHHKIGEFGNDIALGQLRRVTGMVVDESSQQPLVTVIDSWFDHIVGYRLEGELVHSIRIHFKIWDVCLGQPEGSLVVSTGNTDYAMAHWKAPLFTDPNNLKHGQLFNDGQFGQGPMNQAEPYGVSMDKNGRYLITMLAADRIYRIDQSRQPYIYPYGDLKLEGPYHIAKLSNGNTVVSCMLEHKIKIVEEDPESRIFPSIVREWGGLGSDLVSLCYPHGVCVDQRDNIYVADMGNFRVMVYDKDGAFQSCPVLETWNYDVDVKPTNVAVMKDSTLLVMMQGDRYMHIHVYKLKEEEPGCCDCGPESCWANCWDICIGTYRDKYEPIN